MTKEIETIQTGKIDTKEIVIQKTDFYDDDSIVDRPRPKKDQYSTASAQLRLPMPQRKGFMRQWVIDKEQRTFISRDWKTVKGEDGNPMRIVMNHENTKEPEYGTYMEIPEIWFQENLRGDDAIRQNLLNRRMQNKDVVHEVAEGSDSGLTGQVDGTKFYTPSNFENKIERNNK